MRVIERIVAGVAIGVIMTFVHQCSRAQVTSEWAANQAMTVINRASSAGSGWNAYTSTSGVQIGRNFGMVAPGGRVAAAEARIAISNAAASSIAARGFARMLPYVGTAYVAYEILDAAGFIPCGASLCRDQGIPPGPQTVSTWISSNSTLGNFPSADSACSAWISWWNGANSGHPGLMVYKSATVNGAGTQAVCNVDEMKRSAPTECRECNRTFGGAEVIGTQQVDGCAGNQSVRSDGTCAGGVVTPVTFDNAADYITSSNAMTPEQYQNVVDDALGRLDLANSVDFGSLPTGSVGDLQVNVAPEWLEVPGAGGTTPTQDGGQIHFETTWRWTPQTTSSPSPGVRQTTGRWEGTRTTTTINPDGSTTVVEEPAPSDNPDMPDSARCEDGDVTAGCVALGDPPEAEIEGEDVEIDFEVDNLGLPASCPAGYTISVGAFTSNVEYSKVCEVAPVVRFGLLALSAFGAMIWIVTVMRR